MKLKKVLAGALAVVMAAGTILVAPVGTKASEMDVATWWNGNTSSKIAIKEGETAAFHLDISDDNRGGLGAVLVVEANNGTDFADWNISAGVADAWGAAIAAESTVVKEKGEFDNGADGLFTAGSYDITVSIKDAKWEIKAYDEDEDKMILQLESTIAAGKESNTFEAYIYPQFGKFVIEESNSIPVRSIKISGSESSVVPGGTVQLSATAKPSYTTENYNVTWTSSNEAVATVDNTGKVTAVADGEATITAKVSDTVYDEYTIAVVSSIVPITSIELTAAQPEVKVGGTTTLTTKINPENTTDNKNVIYTSSNDKVATVDKDGKVTAVAVGKATITAKVGEFTDTVEITVPEVKATALDVKVDNTTLNVGDSAQITATVTPADSTDAITYESSNGKVVTVEANGKVSAVGAGVATITVKAGELTKTIEFAVNETSKIEMDNLSIEGFWTVHTPGIEIQSGKTYTFTFDAKSKLSGENGQVYYCPVYVVYTNSEAKVNNDSADYKEYFVCRADNYGWTSAGNTFEGTQGAGYLFETNAVPEGDDWLAVYKATMEAGTKGTITAKLSGNNVIVVYDIAGVKTTSTIPVDTSKPVYLGITGEQVDVTNIVAVSQTNNIANKGGAPVMPIALVVLGLGVVVIASKKKFAK